MIQAPYMKMCGVFTSLKKTHILIVSRGADTDSGHYRNFGGEIMKGCAAEMPSYTYAVKGEKLLKARGYQCEVQREEAPSENGCGYSLKIYGDCSRAKNILDSYAIPYTSFVYGGG